jgi:hypothetical protein
MRLLLHVQAFASVQSHARLAPLFQKTSKTEANAETVKNLCCTEFSPDKDSCDEAKPDSSWNLATQNFQRQGVAILDQIAVAVGVKKINPLKPPGCLNLMLSNFDVTETERVCIEMGGEVSPRTPTAPRIHPATSHRLETLPRRQNSNNHHRPPRETLSQPRTTRQRNWPFLGQETHPTTMGTFLRRLEIPMQRAPQTGQKQSFPAAHAPAADPNRSGVGSVQRDSIDSMRCHARVVCIANKFVPRHACTRGIQQQSTLRDPT